MHRSSKSHNYCPIVLNDFEDIEGFDDFEDWWLDEFDKIDNFDLNIFRF